MRNDLVVPRPWRLVWTAVWNLNEAAGIPMLGFLVGDWLWGRSIALVCGLSVAVGVTIIHKLRSGTVPGLMTISVSMLAVQTMLALLTGQAWIYFIQVPVAKLGLSMLFARSARGGRRPLVARLAGEVVALRCPVMAPAGLDHYFRRATWLWAGIFLVLAMGLGAFVVMFPVKLFVVLSAGMTAGLIVAGATVSALWFFSVLRRLGLRLRFGA